MSQMLCVPLSAIFLLALAVHAAIAQTSPPPPPPEEDQPPQPGNGMERHFGPSYRLVWDQYCRGGKWIKVYEDDCPIAFSDPFFEHHDYVCKSSGALPLTKCGTRFQPMWTWPEYGYCERVPVCMACPALGRCDRGPARPPPPGSQHSSSVTILHQQNLGTRTHGGSHSTHGTHGGSHSRHSTHGTHSLGTHGGSHSTHGSHSSHGTHGTGQGGHLGGGSFEIIGQHHGSSGHGHHAGQGNRVISGQGHDRFTSGQHAGNTLSVSEGNFVWTSEDENRLKDLEDMQAMGWSLSFAEEKELKTLRSQSSSSHSSSSSSSSSSFSSSSHSSSSSSQHFSSQSSGSGNQAWWD